MLFFAALFCLGGCAKMDAPPSIKVTAGGEALPSVYGLNKWDGSVYDRKDCFEMLFEKRTADSLPYIKIGEIVYISFNGTAPGTVTLKEILLRGDDGTRKYNAQADTDISVEIKDGELLFTLEDSWATALSSNSADYRAGKNYRGYKMICTWGENECEYAFALRTDPPFVFEIEE
jgi:hypothetical protein